MNNYNAGEGAVIKSHGRGAAGPGCLKFLVLFFCLFCGGGPARAEVPLKVNFQGRLVESGAPVNDQRSFIFRIYDALTGGALLWTSQTHNVTVANGVFSVVLQTGTPVNLSTGTFTGARYVSVSVGGVTLAPRQEMLSVPYALVAQGLSADALIKPSNLDAGVLGPNVVASSTGVNSVSSTSIKDAAVTFVKISSAGCLGSDVMKRNVGNTAWECAVDAGVAGVGGAVTLAPSIADANPTLFNPSIYVDGADSAGELLKLVKNGVYQFTVDNTGKVNISSNVFIVGYSSATKYYGDGSSLTGLGASAADNLGNHTATKDLNLAGFSIVNASSGTFSQGITASSLTATGAGVNAGRLLLAANVAISSETDAAKGAGVAISSNVYVVGRLSAGYYQINGNTVVAQLPGTGSLGLGLGAGPVNAGNYNLFVGSDAGHANTTGAGNVFLGARAGYTVNTGTGNIIIGYNQDASAPAANNEINLGGVYKGSVSSGTATIPKFTVRAVTGDTAATAGETITVNAAADVTVTLPAVTAADIGATITVIKIGAGRVTLAANGTPIADSAATGTIYNNAFAPPYASLTLRLADASRWGIVSGDGAWITTGP